MISTTFATRLPSWKGYSGKKEGRTPRFLGFYHYSAA
jgi:hypothetical protein